MLASTVCPSFRSDERRLDLRYPGVRLRHELGGRVAVLLKRVLGRENRLVLGRDPGKLIAGNARSTWRAAIWAGSTFDGDGD